MSSGIGMPGAKKVEEVEETQAIPNDEFFEILNRKRKVIEIDTAVALEAPTLHNLSVRIERLEAILEKLHTALIQILPKENVFKPKRARIE